jgi:O-antigen/teichoic acid export membrane protein
LNRIKGLFQRKLARNAYWMLLGQGANFFLQALYFILLARLLGVTEYGVFAGAFALVSIVKPYTKLGSNMLFMRYVSRDRALAPVYLGNALLCTTFLSLLIAVVFYFVGPSITSLRSHFIFVLLVLSNCLMSQIAAIGATVFQTFEKMRLTAMLNLLSNLTRLLILIGLWLTMHHANALQWSYAVLAASTFAAALSLLWVRKEVGGIEFDLKLLRIRLSEGFWFSFAGSTQSLYNDVDKTMLSHYGLTRENGVYTLAYRIIDFATTPIIAIDSVVLPRFFQLSHSNMPAVPKLAIRSAMAAALIGLGIAGCLTLLAPIVPRLVGHDFSGVLLALRWLCWIPALRGIHFLAGSALTGSGHQNLRTAAQFVVAGINLLLNLWWIPAYGWIGAAWSSVASDGLLAIINILLFLWLWRRMSRQSPHLNLESAAC